MFTIDYHTSSGNCALLAPHTHSPLAPAMPLCQNSLALLLLARCCCGPLLKPADLFEQRVAWGCRKAGKNALRSLRWREPFRKATESNWMQLNVNLMQTRQNFLVLKVSKLARTSYLHEKAFSSIFSIPNRMKFIAAQLLERIRRLRQKLSSAIRTFSKPKELYSFSITLALL